MRFFLLSALSLVLFTSPALAQGKVVGCGMPVQAELDTEPKEDYCDIYTRQLAYDEQQKSMKEKLLERQKNFVTPRNEAFGNYGKNREALQKAQNKTGNAGNE